MKKTSLATSLLVLITALTLVSGVAIAQDWDGGSATNNNDGGDDSQTPTSDSDTDSSDTSDSDSDFSGDTTENDDSGDSDSTNPDSDSTTSGDTDSTSSDSDSSSGSWDGGDAANDDDGTSTDQDWDGDSANNNDDGSGTSGDWDSGDAENDDDSNTSTSWEGDDATNNDDGGDGETTWDGDNATNNNDGGGDFGDNSTQDDDTDDEETGESDGNTDTSGGSSSGGGGSIDSVDIQVLEPEISFQLSPTPARAGEPVNVEGSIEYQKTDNIEVLLNGQTVAETETGEEGSFSASFTPESIGSHQVTVRSTDASAQTQLEVDPTVGVSNVDSSVRTNSPARAVVCADVSSQVTPDVKLVRGDQTLMTKSQKGHVCFSERLSDGTHEMKVVGEVDGDRDEAWTTVNVDTQNTETADQDTRLLASILQPLAQAFATLVAILAQLVPV